MSSSTIEHGATRAEQGDAPATWSRTCRAGAATIAVWSVVLQLVVGEVIAPVAVIGLVFATLAALQRGERRRLALTTGALAALALLGNLPMTIDELSHPSSGVAFTMSLLVTLAAAVTTVAGIAAFAGRDARAARPVVRAAGAALVAGVAVAVIASLGVDSTQPRPGDVELVAEGNLFDVDRLVVDAGTSGFWLDNRDGIRHTLTVEGTEVELDVPGYAAQRADFVLDPGEHALVCTVPGHEQMRIDLTVAP